jgi:hypothetical protein
MLRSVEQSHENKSAQYRLIDRLIEDAHRQHIILLRENALELPYTNYPMGHRYELGVRDKRWSGGLLNVSEFLTKLEGTQFLETVCHNGLKIRLTDDGAQFADWLIANGRKTDFFSTPYGGWGTPFRIEGMPPEVNAERVAQGNLGQPATSPPSAPDDHSVLPRE